MKVGIIGYGSMGKMLLWKFSESGVLGAGDLCVANRTAEKLDEAREIAGVCNNKELAQISDIVQVLPKFEEACYLGLAPTSTTTVALCYGDSLAVVASGIYGFRDKNYALFHPAGSLGKKLILKVKDLMAKNTDIPCVLAGTLLMDAIPEMSKKKLGIVNIVNKDNVILGIICDGDLRRIIEKHVDIYNVSVDEVMIKNPKTIVGEALAVDALHFIKENSINNLPVIDANNRLVGTITWQQIVKAGIVI